MEALSCPYETYSLLVLSEMRMVLAISGMYMVSLQRRLHCIRGLVHMVLEDALLNIFRTTS
jgi:hypothetical protein